MMMPTPSRAACRRAAGALMVAAATLALPPANVAAQQNDAAIDSLWTGRCVAIETEDGKARIDAAHACAVAQEEALGPQDPRLIGLYRRIAETLSKSGRGAYAALPFRRRAYAASERTHGPAAPETGGAALSYAQALILSGRCERFDPRLYALLDAAAIGFDGAPEGSAARLDGRRRIAIAYADALDYQKAADTLLEGAAPGDPASFAAEDWERIGRWREQTGDVGAAADAYEAALSVERNPVARARMEQRLRKMLFAAGDLERLRRLDE